MNKIKHKIRALLSKTVKNGATEDEAYSALIKAQELMKLHYLEEYELDEKDEIIVNKLKYNSLMVYVLSNLGRLFNCNSWFVTKEYMCFYGYATDVHLASYFYDFILKTLDTAYLKYTTTFEYNDLVHIEKLSKRTIKNNFSKGFLNSIYYRISDIYKQRNSEMENSKPGSNEYALMLITGQKEQDIIRQQFIDFPNLSIKSFTDNSNKPKDETSYEYGSTLADNVDLTIPLQSSNTELLMLEE